MTIHASEATGSGAGGKVCPDCAEEVQAAARVCRYCGYRFEGEATEPTSGSKSAFGAGVLSLVVPGLGHFYLGEGWRGGVFLATFAIAVLGAFATDTIGPGWIIGIVAAVDAYHGARARDAGGRRGVTTAMWVMLTVVIALVTVATALALRGDQSSDFATTSSDEAAAATIKLYLTSLAAGDGVAACDQLTTAGKRDLTEMVHRQVPEYGRMSCPQAIARLAETLDPEEVSLLQDAEPTAVTDGSQGTGDAGGTAVVDLERVGGRWLISGGFGTS